MDYADKIRRLEQGIDSIYANLHLWPHLTHFYKDKLEKLYEDLTFQFVRVNCSRHEEKDGEKS